MFHYLEQLAGTWKVVMEQHQELKKILLSYFDLNIGYADGEDVINFRDNLKDIRFQKYMAGLVASAFKDFDLSWRKLFDDTSVAFYDTEEESREYARKILWDNVFPNKPCPDLSKE